MKFFMDRLVDFSVHMYPTLNMVKSAYAPFMQQNNVFCWRIKYNHNMAILEKKKKGTTTLIVGLSMDRPYMHTHMYACLVQVHLFCKNIKDGDTHVRYNTKH